MASGADELIPTRVTLIQRLKNWQDQSSWQEFFDTYWKLIYDHAVRNGLNDAEAQDVVQETLIDVARHMPGFKYDPAIGSFKSWLFRLVQWRITDQYRKRLPLAVDPPTPLDQAGHGTDALDRVPDLKNALPDAAWDLKWEENLLVAALARVKRRVDPQKYQLFDCAVNKEWASDKVAQTFGVEVEQVYQAKHRVTNAIREELDRLRRDLT
jgi:RNA polymerase sigma factor (sigma-70 family)